MKILVNKCVIISAIHYVQNRFSLTSLTILVKLVYFLLFLSLAVSCKKKQTELATPKSLFWNYVKELPRLKVVNKYKVHLLEVAYVEDEDLVGLTKPDRQKLYRLVRNYTRKFLKLKIRIREKSHYEIKSFFDQNRKAFHHPFLSYPSKSWFTSFFSPKFYSTIVGAVNSVFKAHKPQKIMEYFGHLGLSDNIDEQKDKIAKIFYQNIKLAYSEQDLQGHDLLSFKNRQRLWHFSYGHWDSILYQEKKYDFYLSNTALLGADPGMPIYVISRNGLTNAFVENNRYRKFQGVGLLAVYPILSEGKYFTKFKGHLSKAQKLTVIAQMWVHELGHLLLKKKENYTLKGSIHRAPKSLNYLKWSKSLKVSQTQSKKVAILKHF